MNYGVVPQLNIASMFVTLIVSFLIPVVLWIFFYSKDKRITMAVIAGTIGFIVPQMIIRLPLLQLLGSQQWWLDFLDENRFAGYIIYALSAALFETAGRLLVLKAILRNRLSFYTALGSGIGHGGAESIGLIGLTYINNIVLSFMINNGTVPQIEGIEPSINALIETSPAIFLTAGLERALTIPIQISLSVLIGYFIIRRKAVAGFVYCLAIHFSLDFIVILMSDNNISLWLIEGVVLLFAAAGIVLIGKIKKSYPLIAIPKDAAESAVDEGY